MWGIFDYREKHGFVMVVPTDKEGNVLHPHVLSEDCVCEPSFEFYPETGYYLVTHHSPDNI